MVKVTGERETRAFFQKLPDMIERKLVRGAAKAGAEVIAQQARTNLGSKKAEVAGGSSVLIADSIKVRVRKVETGARATIAPEGPGAYVTPWMEFGTRPHFIQVHEEQRGGRTSRRINDLDRSAAEEGRAGPGSSLKIGGTFVGGTVYHPGADPHPFLRPALDTAAREAVATAQRYIDERAPKLASLPDDDGGENEGR